jgi:hypothetical protein
MGLDLPGRIARLLPVRQALPSARSRLTTSTTVRIFVSSTFRDMQAERDILASRTFAQLRAEAQARGMGLQEIDLRWGVTEQESLEAKVLEICFDEIDASRPFFVALLGARYGDAVADAASHLAVLNPELVKYTDRSLTELEVRHAVLNAPSRLARARPLVYLHSGADRQSSERDRMKIAALVAELRSSGIQVNIYADVFDLDEQLQRDLKILIETEFPEPRVRDEFSAAQSAFQSLHGSNGFQRPRVLQRLKRCLWIRRRIVVEGKAGAGKSALLVALYLDLMSRGDRDRAPLMLSVRAAGGLWDRAVCGMLGNPVAKDAGRAFDVLTAHLHRHRGITIIDGLESGADDVFGVGLEWLPDVKPQGALVVSTSDPSVASLLVARGFAKFELDEPSIAEFLEMVRANLAGYGKVLDEMEERQVVDSVADRSPAYAAILSEELRNWGRFEQLDAEIGRLTAATDPRALFDRVLGRLEGLAGVRVDIVPRLALRLLLAARSGLAEFELLSILGRDGQPLPMRAWSPVRLALRTFVLDRMGVLSIENGALKDAILSRYGSDSQTLFDDRKLIADYFFSFPNEPRSLDELMFLLPATRDWERAAALICDEAWLASARNRDTVGLEAFVASILAAEPDRERRLLDMLEHIIQASPIDSAALAAAELLMVVGRPVRVARAVSSAMRSSSSFGSLELRELAAEAYARAGRLSDALQGLSDLGKEDLPKAMSLRIRERAGGVALEMGQIDIAERLFCELLGEVVDGEGRRRLLCHLAAITLRKGQARSSLKIFSTLVREAKREKDLDALCAGFSGIGMSLRELGSIERASKAYSEEEALWRRRGDRVGLAKCLLNQSSCAFARDDFDAGSALLMEAYTHAHEGGHRYLASNILRKQLDVLEAIGLGRGSIAERLRRALAELSASTEDRPFPALPEVPPAAQ